MLVAVTHDERPLKQVADGLGISMRMVQRHLSSIYQKNNTQTRAGLSKAFPSTQKAANQLAGRGTTPSLALFEESLDHDFKGPGGHGRRQ